MAMDNFLEEVATRRNRGVETAMYILANLMMVAFGALAMLYFMSSSFHSKRGIGILEYCANVTAIVLSNLITLFLCLSLLLYQRTGSACR